MFNEEGMLNKLLTVAVVGLLSWNVLTTHRLSVDVAVMKNSLQSATEDRYTQNQANSDFRILEGNLKTLEVEQKRILERLRNLEGKIENL